MLSDSEVSFANLIKVLAPARLRNEREALILAKAVGETILSVPTREPITQADEAPTQVEWPTVQIPRMLTPDFYPGHADGVFSSTPRGVILHSSRSGLASRSPEDEFRGTAYYATVEPSGRGWAATIGPGMVALHMQATQWGQNSGECSSRYLAISFTQNLPSYPIGEAQVESFCWWFQNVARVAWPTLPRWFPTHAEMNQADECGVSVENVTDPFAKGDVRADHLRTRIIARLNNIGVLD